MRYWIASIVLPCFPIRTRDVGARDAGRDRLVPLFHVDPTVGSQSTRDLREHIVRRARRPAVPATARLLGRRSRPGGRGRRGRVEGGHDTGGRHADAEQPALALGDHLERDRVASKPRKAALELAQRHPLGLADRLALRLDDRISRGKSVVAHRRDRFFLRRTRRGGPCACGFACAAGFAAAGLPVVRCRRLGLCSRAGVRESVSAASRRLRDQAARDQALADRPQVRRDPVEDEAGREADDEGHEDDRAAPSAASAASCRPSST